MGSEYYFLRDGQEHGPFSGSQVKELAAHGKLRRSDLIWKAGMDEWVEAGHVKSLFTSAPQAVPTSPLVNPTVESKKAVPPPLPTRNESPAAPIQPPIPTTAFPQSAANLRESVSDFVSKGTAASSAFAKKAATFLSESNGSSDSVPSKPLPPLPTGVAEQDVLAFVHACYRGGHPKMIEQAEGAILLTASTFYFLTAREDQVFSLPCNSISAILEPKPGSFSAEMLKQAELAKSASSTGKIVASVAGGLIGGIGGHLVRAVGNASIDSVRGGTALGSPPRNRLPVVLLDGGVRYTLLFDVMAASKEAMQEDAHHFWMRTAPARHNFAKGSSGKSTSTVTSSKPSTAKNSDASRNRQSAQAGTTKFKVLRQGGVFATHSAEEIRSRLVTGNLSQQDLVAVEIWLPIGLIGALGGVVAADGQPAASSAGVRTARPDGSGDNSDRLDQTPLSTDPADSDNDESRRFQPQDRKSSVAKLAAGAAAGVAASLLVSQAMSASSARAGDSLGIGNSFEFDQDGDGRSDAIAIDRNNDGAIDAIGMDTNRDGQIDAAVLDTDFDGRADVVVFDRDGDGEVDAIARDTDQDGHFDTVGLDEDGDDRFDAIAFDRNQDGVVDAIAVDSDGDDEIDVLVQDADYDGDFSDDADGDEDLDDYAIDDSDDIDEGVDWDA